MTPTVTHPTDSVPGTLFEQAAKAGRGKRVYSGVLDLSKEAIETGKYYEIHAEVPEPGY